MLYESEADVLLPLAGYLAAVAHRSATASRTTASVLAATRAAYRFVVKASAGLY